MGTWVRIKTEEYKKIENKEDLWFLGLTIIGLTLSLILDQFFSNTNQNTIIAFIISLISMSYIYFIVFKKIKVNLSKYNYLIKEGDIVKNTSKEFTIKSFDENNVMLEDKNSKELKTVTIHELEANYEKVT